MAANAIIGLAVGAMLHLSCGKKRKYMFFDIFVIVLSCALGLLITKTAIGCWLYEIPFGIKIVKMPLRSESTQHWWLSDISR
jgi:hypothetical protein